MGCVATVAMGACDVKVQRCNPEPVPHHQTSSHEYSCSCIPAKICARSGTWLVLATCRWQACKRDSGADLFLCSIDTNVQHEEHYCCQECAKALSVEGTHMKNSHDVVQQRLNPRRRPADSLRLFALKHLGSPVRMQASCC